KGNLLLLGDFVAIETNPWFDSESGHHSFRNGRLLTSVLLYKVNKLSPSSCLLLSVKIYWQLPLFVGKNVGNLSSMGFLPTFAQEACYALN
ncbi:hypothetical protein, partial [Lelliottia sp. RWM.1]|uniref:hypothetical protein n=1 Tax=Lelliottia sp. RWM.1 TaxID=2663242 RepID=UPI00193D8533